MSQLRYIGPEPRGSHDIARYSDISKAQGNLLGHSQIQDIIAEQMVQLNMATTAEFDQTRSNYALKSNMDSVLREYIPRSDYGETTVQLDESGRIPRGVFRRSLQTSPAKVYSATTTERNVGGSSSTNISSITIPSQPSEFYVLPFGTFYFAHSGMTHTSRVEIRKSDGTVIGRGETVELSPSVPHLGDFHTYGITILPVPSEPLSPGSSQTIHFRFIAGEHLFVGYSLKVNPWCVVCIPKGD